jgi:hypothetical protein
MIASWINRGWWLACRSEGLRFELATRQVKNSQLELWRSLVATNGQSQYGQRYQFESLRSIDEYRERVPIVSYESLRKEIDRIGDGEINILTREKVERFVPTGGSSGGAKLIPYTATLKGEFQRAIAAWIWSTFRIFPKVMQGRAYWSVTPMATQAKATAGGVSIGFENDSEYLSAGARWFAERLVLPPTAVGRLRNIENARYATLCYLLASPDLALISVWSPSFLTALLASVEGWIELIADDIATGRIRLPKPSAESAPCTLTLKADQKKSREILDAAKSLGVGQEFYQNLWPRLALVSCWGDGNSAGYLEQIRTLLPKVAIQPKGLLATECVVSIPRPVTKGCTLAIRSHFFEFDPVSAAQECAQPKTMLAHELNLGERYRVIVTTGGGLYRYDLGDEVEVVGYDGECPCIQFVGRGDAISDLVGEKLNENHVREVMERLFRKIDLRPGFYILVPKRQMVSTYQLILTADWGGTIAAKEQVRAGLELGLRENPQYELARQLNQLREVEVIELPLRSSELLQRFEEWENQRGRRVGDIKVSVLDYRGVWSAFLSQLLS